MLTLPSEIADACAPLFAAIPFEQSMPWLLGSHPRETGLVQEILRQPALANRPELATALWLYVDDLERSHTISQDIHDTTGSYWHGIMHRREGDFSNSHYWLRRAQGHPLLQSGSGLDSDRLIDQVAAARNADLPELVERQRQEWKALFEWCAARTL